MKSSKFFLIMTILFLLLPLSVSSQVLKPIKTSQRPVIKWAPIKKAATYRVVVKEIDSSTGKPLSSTVNLVSATMWQPENDLTGSLYRIKVKAVKKKAAPLTIYIEPDGRYVNVPAEDILLASNYSNTYTDFNYADASILSGSDGLVVIADVKLPDGVRLKEIVVYYEGGSSSKNINVLFYQVPFETTDLTSETLSLVDFNIQTQGDIARLRSQAEDVSGSNIVIDNENLRYQVLAVLNEFDGISSVRFYYDGETL